MALFLPREFFLATDGRCAGRRESVDARFRNLSCCKRSPDRRPGEHLTWLWSIPKGIFIPVSEDKEGVFTMRPMVCGSMMAPMVCPLCRADFMVSKTKPNTIFAYFGDARRPGWVF